MFASVPEKDPALTTYIEEYQWLRQMVWERTKPHPWFPVILVAQPMVLVVSAASIFLVKLAMDKFYTIEKEKSEFSQSIDADHVYISLI